MSDYGEKLDAEVDSIIDDVLQQEKDRKKSFEATVKVGDTVYAIDDGTYIYTEFKYRTAGKGYEVKSILSNGSIICDSDIVDDRLYLYVGSITHVVRDRQIIWDSRQLINWKYEGVRYRGYYIKSDYPENSEYNCTLVKLITPFRNGKSFQNMIINHNEVEFIED